ncbi:MAG: hypothetical protein IT427_11215 [Pirellulales bacterium]|nr:hypothetical protein [Pirellulales bacterium]
MPNVQGSLTDSVPGPIPPGTPLYRLVQRVAAAVAEQRGQTAPTRPLADKVAATDRQEQRT